MVQFRRHSVVQFGRRSPVHLGRHSMVQFRPSNDNYHRDRAVYHKHEHVGADGGPIRISTEAKIDALVAAMQPHELEALVRQALMAPPEAAIKEIAAPRDHDLLDAELVED
ncbi:MAG TPA: hypothetical protein VKF37_10470 [Chloroflexota bacterium]|nr:hypothetical protein [Chloroflexota bacterium]